MIQANELRVNNLVKRNDLEGIYSIRGVCKDRVHPIELEELFKDSQGNNAVYGCQCTLSELEPIPLTPAILEKSGFVKTDHVHPLTKYSDYRLGNCVASAIESGVEIEYCGLDIEERTYIIKIKSLHQLQNLYFALTGEELTINP